VSFSRGGLAPHGSEWNFTKSESIPQDPSRPKGFYRRDEYLSRDMYYSVPRNRPNRRGRRPGKLRGGSVLGGIGSRARCPRRKNSRRSSHAELTEKHGKYPAARGGELRWNRSAADVDMGANNFLFEILFLTSRPATKAVQPGIAEWERTGASARKAGWRWTLEGRRGQAVSDSACEDR